MLKRTISLLLSMLMLLSLCACAPAADPPQEEPAAPVLQVGYSRVDITPKTEVPMGGYGNSHNRISEGVAYPLEATCIAFTYGEEKVLLFTQDLINSSWFQDARAVITPATGVPADRIMICATHTHHTPDQTSKDARITKYKSLYQVAMTKAAVEALEDCAPATLYAGKTETEGLNFVRHYLLSDGTYGGDNFGNFSANTIVGHATVGDPQMLVLKADREGDKKDIAIVNWQAHPCKTEGGSKNRLLSPDFIAPMRMSFEHTTGMHFAYFTGAAGNQNTSTRIASENNYLSFGELGTKLAECAISAMNEAKPLEGAGIRCTTQNQEFAMNHDKEGMITEANEVITLWQGGTNSTEANKLARSYGFSSVYEASAVRVRAKRPATGTYELNAIYVGGWAFVTAPYEMFTNMALRVKEESPFEHTMVFSCANGSNGYFATVEAYEYGSYEGTTSRFAKGCAEDSVEAMLQMLNSLK